jgi:hypothetical protein
MIKARLYITVLKVTRKAFPEIKKKRKFFNPTQGLLNIPREKSNSLKASTMPAMGRYEKTTKKRTAGQSIKSSSLLCRRSWSSAGIWFFLLIFFPLFHHPVIEWYHGGRGIYIGKSAKLLAFLCEAEGDRILNNETADR